MAQQEVERILPLIESLEMTLKVSERLKVLVKKKSLYIAEAEEVDTLMECLNSYVKVIQSNARDFSIWMQ